MSPEDQKNAAYAERNKLVVLISSLFPSWLENHPASDLDWEDDWRTIVFVMLPSGQACWHVHDSERWLFQHLEFRPGNSWDGHTTAEKYDRVLAALRSAGPKGESDAD